MTQQTPHLLYVEVWTNGTTRLKLFSEEEVNQWFPNRETMSEKGDSLRYVYDGNMDVVTERWREACVEALSRAEEMKIIIEEALGDLPGEDYGEDNRLREIAQEVDHLGKFFAEMFGVNYTPILKGENDASVQS